MPELALSPQLQTFGCRDLIGLRYVPHANGENGEIDCIFMVYAALRSMRIPTPPFNTDWWTANPEVILRALSEWGYRITRPDYDGDVLVLPDQETGWSFGVVWQTSFLHINRQRKRVVASPISDLPKCRIYRSFHMRGR